MPTSNINRIFGEFCAKELYQQGKECAVLNRVLKEIDSLEPGEDYSHLVSAGLISLSCLLNTYRPGKTLNY